MGAKHARPILAALEELGHKQPTTGSPFETDNKTAQGILNSKMRQKLSKSFDMRYWWMKDRINQGQFNLICPPRQTIVGRLLHQVPPAVAPSQNALQISPKNIQ
jgi:hypothetical protein